jgi:hypothetical protein
MLKLNINADEIFKKTFEETTKIENLEHANSVVFIDETRREHVCFISTINFKNYKKYVCFWCRYSITENPIGCPITYLPSQEVSMFKTKTGNEIFIINEDVMTKVDDNKQFIEKNYYISDGIFCSFNCCQAFINDHEHDSRYNYSTFLLAKIFQELTNSFEPIMPANHWRTIECYGGFQTITQFRSGFNKYKILYFGQVKFNSLGYLYEPILSFNI